jgi:phosphatidylserine synthase
MSVRVTRAGIAGAGTAKVLVTGVTLAAIGSAVLACGLLLAGSRAPAFLFLVVAMALDMIDGPLARRAGVQSKLGAWLDTGADIFVYLLFPVIYWRAAYDLPVLVLALFCGAGLFRLVRFSLLGFVEDQGKVYYAGMPVFYNQLLLVLTYAITFNPMLLGVLLITGAVLMVSTIPFRKIPVRVLAGGLAIYIVLVVGRLLNVF